MRKNRLITLSAILAVLVVVASCGKSGDNEKTQEEEATQENAERHLISHYNFDDGTATDVSGNDYDGVVFNRASYITDTPSGTGSALFLNGIKEQCVNIPYNLFAGLQAYSIALWVKDFSTGALVSGISTYGPYCYPRLYLGNDGKLKFASNSQYLDYTPSFEYNCSSILSDSWHHIAVTCSSDSYRDSKLNLYIDGILTDSITSKWRDNASDNVTKINIGGNGYGYYPVYPSMKVDNVRFYDIDLSGKEIKRLFDERL